MLKRIIDYSNKYFGLSDLIEGITDLRANPQISAADVASSVLSMIFSNLDSLNKFNQSRDFSYAKNIAARIPSASTVARAADTIDLNCS